MLVSGLTINKVIYWKKPALQNLGFKTIVPLFCIDVAPFLIVGTFVMLAARGVNLGPLDKMSNLRIVGGSLFISFGGGIALINSGILLWRKKLKIKAGSNNDLIKKIQVSHFSNSNLSDSDSSAVEESIGSSSHNYTIKQRLMKFQKLKKGEYAFTNENETINVKKIKFIGNGEFNKIYLVKINDGQEAVLRSEKHESSKQRSLKRQLLKIDQAAALQQELIEAKAPHIAEIYFYAKDEIKDKNRTVIEYCSLDNLQKNLPRLSKPLKLQIAQQIVEGVAAMHELKIVHRDLKLENILLTADFEPKIADFDFALRKGDVYYSAVGTHIAPESSDDPGRRVATLAYDVWALGWILYQIKYGERNQFSWDVNKYVDGGWTREKVEVWVESLKLDPKDPYDQLLIQIFQEDPKQRPTSKEIYQKISKISDI